MSELLRQACSSLNSARELFESAAVNLTAASDSVAKKETDKVEKRVLANRLQREKRKNMRSTTQSKTKTKKITRTKLGPTVSPHFPTPPKKKRNGRREVGPTISPYFPFDQSREPFIRIPTPPGLSFKLEKSESPSSLIQERICADLFALVVQAILWNKTKGSFARPVLWKLLCKYPTAEALAAAVVDDIARELHTLGLQNVRAVSLINMSKAWVAAPPCPERRYRRLHYPRHGHGRDVKAGECLGSEDPRQGWEIAHLPGVGEYAIDSFRIFGRDRLRGLHNKPGVQPEWKQLVPRDKELGPYVQWKWRQEGWDYDLVTGARVRSDSKATARSDPPIPSAMSWACAI